MNRRLSTREKQETQKGLVLLDICDILSLRSNLAKDKYELGNDRKVLEIFMMRV